MKRFVAGLAMACAVALAAGSTFAKPMDKKQSNGIKIGYVDVQRALDEVEEAKRIKAQLQKEFDEKKKKLDVMKEELEKMQLDLEKQKLVLSEGALRSKQQEMHRMYAELRQNAMQYQQELARKESEAVGRIIKSFEQIITEIGEKEGYTLIFEKSQGDLLYAPSGFDLTDRLIKIYNKRFGRVKKR